MLNRCLIFDYTGATSLKFTCNRTESKSFDWISCKNDETCTSYVGITDWYVKFRCNQIPTDGAVAGFNVNKQMTRNDIYRSDLSVKLFILPQEFAFVQQN